MLKILTIEDLIAKIRKKNPQVRDKDINIIQEAYNFADKAYQGQLHKTGEKFIQHWLRTAYFVCDLLVETDTLVAALLHNVEDFEDSSQKINLEEIKNRFGVRVFRVLQGMSLVSKVKFRGEFKEIDSLKRMFLAFAEDTRVVFIRLCDRLHKVKTLTWLPEQEKKRIAQETMLIFAPLADRLGLWEIKQQLEDACFQILHPKEYENIFSEIYKNKESQISIKKISGEIKEIMDNSSIQGKVSGRSKHLFSIYKKMQTKNLLLEEVYDIYAIRVIVDSVEDCYHLIWLIHTKWKPIPKKIKDYIASPKSNGYQSLHTTISILGYEKPLEIQIRTKEMHLVAEYGAAAHWGYSEEKKVVKVNNLNLDWLKKNEIDKLEGEDLFNYLKEDLLSSDRVYVFTPQEKFIDLPKGATPIDFAYTIHSDIGHKVKMAKVNGKIVPLNYELKNGETVTVLLNKKGKPNRFRLSFVKTSIAKNRIKNWFKKLNKWSNVESWLKILNHHLAKYDLPEFDKIDGLNKKVALSKLKYKEWEDVLAGIGSSVLSPIAVIRKLFDEDKIVAKRPKKIKKEVLNPLDIPVLIEGEYWFKYEFAKCCSPTVGKPIVAFISNNSIFKIHLDNCKILKKVNKDKIKKAHFKGYEDIDAKKEVFLEEEFEVTLQITMFDKAGSIHKVTGVFAREKINLEDLFTKKSIIKKLIYPFYDKFVIIKFSINDLQKLDQILFEIENIPEVHNLKVIKEE